MSTHFCPSLECQLSNHKLPIKAVPTTRFVEVHDEEVVNSILSDIIDEVSRQEILWGEYRHLPSGTSDSIAQISIANLKRDVCNNHAETGKVTWKDILDEEVYEAFAEIEDEALLKELTQSAAVIISWMRDIKTR